MSRRKVSWTLVKRATFFYQLANLRWKAHCIVYPKASPMTGPYPTHFHAALLSLSPVTHSGFLQAVQQVMVLLLES